jgi:hypothetical protein
LLLIEENIKFIEIKNNQNKGNGIVKGKVDTDLVRKNIVGIEY